jgi:hypothetical protein
MQLMRWPFPPSAHFGGIHIVFLRGGCSYTSVFNNHLNLVRAVLENSIELRFPVRMQSPDQPGTHVVCGNRSGLVELSVTGSPADASGSFIPRWLSMAQNLLTSLSLTDVVMKTYNMFALVDLSRRLETLALRRVLIAGWSRKDGPPAWAAVWETAARCSNLRSVIFEDCGYTITRLADHSGVFQPVSPDEEEYLSVFQKDAMALHRFREIIATRGVETAANFRA